MINFSNHPSDRWSEEQRCSADGVIVDVPFPQVDPAATAAGVSALVERSFNEIVEASSGGDDAVFVAGESSLAFGVILRLLVDGRRVVTATTRRTVEELPDGTTVRKFEFCQWREFQLPHRAVETLIFEG